MPNDIWGYYEKSPELKILDKEVTHKNKKIYYITQFFIHRDPKRAKEIRFCMKKLSKVKALTKIILLNERIYTDKELGVSSDNIEQVDMGERFTFKHVFDYIQSAKLKGYIVFGNSDIFVDETIRVLLKTNLHLEKSFIGLLRYDYNVKNRLYKIFGPRFDSQDTWIIHSNQNVGEKFRKAFDFKFGMPACDNKVFYLMKILGYKVYNTPLVVKIYHVHDSEVRDQNFKTDILHKPFLFLDPPFYTMRKAKIVHGDGNARIYQRYFDIMDKTNELTKYTMSDNDVFRNYISEKIAKNENFIITSVFGIESDYARVILLKLHNQNNPDDRFFKQANTFIKDNTKKMEDEAMVAFKDEKESAVYAQIYMNIMRHCDKILTYELFNESNSYLKYSQDFILGNFQKEELWARVLEVYQFLYNKPWTNSLKGKRLLFISDKADIFKAQAKNMKKIYKRDLFPECELLFHKMDYFKGHALYDKNFNAVFSTLVNALNRRKHEYDIILTDCKGYNNLVCDYAFNNGKSCIYIGDVMCMYFGVVNKEWSEHCKDILLLFKNKYWYDERDGRDAKKKSDVVNINIGQNTVMQ